LISILISCPQRRRSIATERVWVSSVAIGNGAAISSSVESRVGRRWISIRSALTYRTLPLALSGHPARARAGSPERNSLPSSHRVSGRHPSGRRRLAGEGEKRAGSGRVAPRTRPDPGAAGEGDAPHPMQNSEIKIQAVARRCYRLSRHCSPASAAIALAAVASTRWRTALSL